MDDQHILHLTIGPVQGFVAQARRTRDLWAGSFLLAWLAGHAIAATRKHGGTIVFPPVDADPLLVAIEKRGVVTPEVGSLPNRFKARIPAGFDPRHCSDAVQAAWGSLADAVWHRFIANRAQSGHGTQEIWDRQINNFWEIAWVTDRQTGDGSDGAWLDQRKNWRNHLPPTEAGDHCTMMGDWQEISGHLRSRDRGRQDQFWAALQQQGSGVDELELRDGERLCAIALVKRLFPRLDKNEMKNSIGWIPGGDIDRVGRWPSTGHVAAGHWIANALGPERLRGACERYAEYVKKNLGPICFGERVNRLKCLDPHADSMFRTLDANLLYADDIRNPYTLVLPAEADRAAVLAEHQALLAALKRGEPTPYYALLLMDGDSVGKLLGLDEGEQVVGAALAAFTGQVGDIVETHNGMTVYAGGDDVLAMLPVVDAMQAAVALRAAYAACFPGGWAATTSAGLVFADHHEPLRAVIAEAHRLLDTVAKDRNGRDSIAISVLQPSGRTVEWVSRWNAMVTTGPVQEIDALSHTMQSDPQFSNSFVYNLDRRWLAPLRGGFTGLGLEADEAKRVVIAELAKNRAAPATAKTLEGIAGSIAGTQGVTADRGPAADLTGLRIDGLRLARFLAACRAGS